MMEVGAKMTQKRTRVPNRFRGSFSRTPELREPKSGRRGEMGSSLILALVYIVAISLVVGALTDWAMNDLNNTTHFQSATSVQAAVSGATEVAIQSIRYYPQYPATENTYNNCFAPASGTVASEVQINQTWVAVWCSTVAIPTSQNTRTVTFVACTESSSSVLSTTLVQCESQPYLKAVVIFGDYPSGGGGLDTSVCTGGQSVCGFSATTTQWTWTT
jgi:hypothetical protein